MLTIPTETLQPDTPKHRPTCGISFSQIARASTAAKAALAALLLPAVSQLCAQTGLFHDGFEDPLTPESYAVYNMQDASTLGWTPGRLSLRHADTGSYTELSVVRLDAPVDISGTLASGDALELVIHVQELADIFWPSIRNALVIGFELSDGRNLSLMVQSKGIACAFNLMLDEQSLMAGMNDIPGIFPEHQWSVEATQSVEDRSLILRVTDSHVEFWQGAQGVVDGESVVMLGRSVPHGLNLGQETAARPLFKWIRRYASDSGTQQEAVIRAFSARTIRSDEEEALETRPLTLRTGATTRAVHPSMPGANHWAMIADPWTEPSRIQALEDIRPATLRYPGGSVATYWDMETGKLFRSGPAIDADNGIVLNQSHVLDWVAQFTADPKPNAVEDLALGYAAHPFQTVFVLNMTTPGADYYRLAWGRNVNNTPLSADWWAMMDDRYARNLIMLDKALQNNMPVDFVEFGNEYFFGVSAEHYVSGYFGSQANRLFGAFPDSGTAYADVVNDWAAKLKQRYPGVALCAIAALGEGSESARQLNWNETVLSRIDRTLVDAVSIHHYADSGMNNPSDVEDASDLGTWFARWRDEWISQRTTYKVPGDWELWFTEYNLDISDPLSSTWANGLFLSWMQYYWLFNEKVGLLCPHQFDQGLTNGPVAPIVTAEGAAYSLWTRAASGAAGVRPLSFPEDPGLPGSFEAGNDPLPGLLGLKFEGFGDGSSKYLVVNLLNENWELPASAFPGASYSQYSTGTLGQTLKPMLQQGQVADGNHDGKMVLKAYSITLIDGPADSTGPTDVFPGSRLLGSGYFSSDWFGRYYGSLYPWIYHDAHGWLYALGSGEETVFLYSQSLQTWLAARPDAYPFLYNMSTENWFYFPDLQADSTRTFYFDFLSGLWVTVGRSGWIIGKPGLAGSKSL